MGEGGLGSLEFRVTSLGFGAVKGESTRKGSVCNYVGRRFRERFWLDRSD